jgi:hypothetical protein
MQGRKKFGICEHLLEGEGKWLQCKGPIASW